MKRRDFAKLLGITPFIKVSNVVPNEEKMSTVKPFIGNVSDSLLENKMSFDISESNYFFEKINKQFFWKTGKSIQFTNNVGLPLFRSRHRIKLESIADGRQLQSYDYYITDNLVDNIVDELIYQMQTHNASELYIYNGYDSVCLSNKIYDPNTFEQYLSIFLRINLL